MWSWSLRFVGAVLVLVGGGPCDSWGRSLCVSGAVLVYSACAKGGIRRAAVYGDILLGWLCMGLGINRVLLAPRFSC